MSLFDRIKYPINLPPGLDQIEALPEAIYQKWVCHPDCSWEEFKALKQHRDRVHRWMAEGFDEALNHPADYRKIVKLDIELLRKIIEEHE